jgi:hypothetical protein
VSGGTAGATSARWDESEDNVVAGRKPTNAFTNLLNNASAFVTTNNGECEWKVTSCEVLV